MFVAGVFGTVAGDLIHHTVGMLTASAVLSGESHKEFYRVDTARSR
jgi:hypothetical protein